MIVKTVDDQGHTERGKEDDVSEYVCACVCVRERERFRTSCISRYQRFGSAPQHKGGLGHLLLP